MGTRAGSAEPSRTGSVPSLDGTSVGFYTVGSGAGVVLVHGAGQSSKNLRALADLLATDFAVHVPDRRGRAMSPTYGDFQGLGTEVADLSALLLATGSRMVFGLSAGAVIALETALVRPEITKLALYEPPLDLIIRRSARATPPPGALSPHELIPTPHYDAVTVIAAKGPLERFEGLRCQVLLLGGEKSARNLTASVDGLSKVLSEATRVELPGVGHSAADNSRQPALVTRELHHFFAG